MMQTHLVDVPEIAKALEEFSTPDCNPLNAQRLIADMGASLGQRLRSVIGDKQKTFADINGKPFLDIVLNFLKKQGIRRVILLTGFAAEEIEAY